MSNLVVFILLCYGISNAVVFTDGPAYIFKKFREYMQKAPSNLGHGVECMICFPFQIGIIFSVIDYLFFDAVSTPMNLILGDNNNFWPLTIIMDGAIASGSVWLLHTLQEALERFNTIEEANDE